MKRWWAAAHWEHLRRKRPFCSRFHPSKDDYLRQRQLRVDRQLNEVDFQFWRITSESYSILPCSNTPLLTLLIVALDSSILLFPPGQDYGASTPFRSRSLLSFRAQYLKRYKKTQNRWSSMLEACLIGAPIFYPMMSFHFSSPR